jgi:hypothetical protein
LAGRIPDPIAFKFPEEDTQLFEQPIENYYYIKGIDDSARIHCD